jgi:hypothetical protein
MSSDNGDDDDFFVDDEEFSTDSFIEQLISFKPSVFDEDSNGTYGIFQPLNDISSFVNETYGTAGMYAMLCAIESQTGWSLEIIGSKKDIESEVWNKYGVFDEDAWLKARNSPYWDMMVRDVFRVSQHWLDHISAHVAEQQLPLKVRLKHAWRMLTQTF